MKPDRLGEYFCVSLDKIKAIANLHLGKPSVDPATCDTVATYVILCRGAGKDCVTGWTAHGVRKRTHMTLRRAERAIEWLILNRFIAPIGINEDDNQSVISTASQSGRSSTIEAERATGTKKETYRYEILRHHTGECINLPNSIIDGQKGHKCEPPLKRLLARCQPDLHTGISLSNARTDAVLLLLQLYSVHDLDIDGGVKHEIWRGDWKCEARKNEFETSKSESSIGDPAFDFFSAQAEREFFDWSHIGDMFVYIGDNKQRNLRIEHALKNLRALRFLYQVVQIWGKGHGSSQHGTLQYPLHIFDQAQRDRDEPAVGPKIRKLLESRFSANDGISDTYQRIVKSICGDTDGRCTLDSEVIIFVAARGISMFPRTSLRLRYRAHDADTAAGNAEQERMAEIWQATLESLPVTPSLSRI